MTPRILLIGHESLTVQCGTMISEAGYAITGVVTADAEVRDWATGNGHEVHLPGRDLAARLAGQTFDWIISAANLTLIGEDVLQLAAKGAVNFHDGPLPTYAGLNAPVWALLNGEAQHGVTWHVIAGGVDEGDIIAQQMIDISDSETAFTLNTKCYAAGIESFGTVLPELAKETPATTPQDLSKRSYFARDDRPLAGAMLDFSQTTVDVLRFVRALDHGGHTNPLALPKIRVQDHIVIVGAASEVDGIGEAGALLGATSDGIRVATSDGAVLLSGLMRPDGTPFNTKDHCRKGLQFATPDPSLTADMAIVAKAKTAVLRRLIDMTPAALHLPGKGGGTQTITTPTGTTPAQIFGAFARLCHRAGDGGPVTLARASEHLAQGLASTWTPIPFDPDHSEAFQAVLDTPAIGFAVDLPLRTPGLHVDVPEAAISTNAPVPEAAVTLVANASGATLHGNSTRIGEEGLTLLAARLEAELAGNSNMPATERAMVTNHWNRTAKSYPKDACIHQMFETQVAKSPDATALVYEGEVLSYATLNSRANQLAHVLQAQGAKPGSLVGLNIRRSSDLVIAALAIQKAGAAYVPLDPAYPADRVALYIEDSGADIIVTEAALAGDLPAHNAKVVSVDTDPAIAAAPDTNPASGVRSSDLAYLIYTSGSTGRPKGVMIEHRNVSNFFTGMDARIEHKDGGTWLAVTSLSFDISVLELFWTLARGFKVVISGDESRALVSSGATNSGPGEMDFSLYYWGNDDVSGQGKYHLLLEGAKFADQNGFCAVWTPERHFHAFGGPYPNPSVTGAAVAAVTNNLAVRAGSCVAPLHHPARIAEEWAVVDNLTNGRVGLAMASGWQPDDFVLRPENTPPKNKPALFETIETVRKLWAGDTVEFPRADGEMHGVVTQPRPVSKTLPIWVTSAGNPETWREAGALGANVLTHLLGQTVEEVKGKIEVYHAALREAGHDPADFKVTLMLHTYLADTAEEAKEIACEPMKDYLRSAAGLIKQYAWAFPAFKKPEGATNAFDLDLGSLEPDEMEGILDFAFERYFNDSGLFGTVEDVVKRVEEIKSIGVAEVACLIDYGIDTDTVLAGLRPLAEVVARCNTGTSVADDDYSIAAQLTRHKVTHMQCTPSMARMLVTNDDSRAALSTLKHLMVGGEALPGALVSDLKSATNAHIENMYGPTETTIWSTTRTAEAGDGITGIGTPIANTQVYVLDEDMAPVPVGSAGELWIGGAGVARGYWQREDLTAERFKPNPFAEGRIYQTGDLVRWRPDGTLDFLGRADHQVKLRGYRIELGEIEAALDELASIRQSVVIAREDTPGLTQLVGYALATSDFDEASVRAKLAETMPAHMVPTRIVTLDAFPLTPNKKIDRKALPAPEMNRPKPRLITTSAPSKVEGAGKVIAEIWTKLLGVQDISDRDNFFELGGHSLLAVQAHRDIKAALGINDLSITDIFRFPTLGALAARLEKAPATAPQDAPQNQRAAQRTDAMARRRDMRARRAARG